MKKFFLLILIITAILSCSLNQTLDEALREAIDTKAFGKTVWTVMVYMCADNNLNPQSVYDVNEMILAGGSNKNLNIVLLWDQTTSYAGGDRHGYYLVTSTGPKLLYNTDEVNMGNVDTTKNFIDFAIANYKADRYIFVLWDHGDGVDKSTAPESITTLQKSIAQDSSSGGDMLTDTEQKEVFQHFYNKIGKKIDILIYDACVMGLVELMCQAKDYFNYFIGSEDNVPGSGMNYRFLKEILDYPDINPKEIAKSVVTYYQTSNIAGTYPFLYAPYDYPTLTAIDLTKIDNLVTLLTSFANAATNSSNKDCFYYSAIKTDLTFYPSMLGDMGYVDIYYYMNNVITKLTSAGATTHPAISIANDIMNYIENSGVVIKEYYASKHTGKANGISIYIDALDTTSVYRSNSFNTATTNKWSAFLDWIH